MSNTVGGLILIGISDQRKIMGIDPEEERFMVNAANDYFCVPKVSLQTYTVTMNLENPFEDEKNILIIQVHPTRGPKIFVKKKQGTTIAY